MVRGIKETIQKWAVDIAAHEKCRKGNRLKQSTNHLTKKRREPVTSGTAMNNIKQAETWKKIREYNADVTKDE